MLPSWLRTIRARLALTYSAVLFGVTALLLGGIYLALAGSVESRPLDPVTVKKFEKGPGGTVKYRPGEDFQAADIEDVQAFVNFSTLETLRTYSWLALAGLFVLSLAVGWWVAGRALRPVGAITTTARDISATDLSRRIPTDGPPDELRTLGETINGMLERIERAFTAQRDLVDDVSHELRNPVAVIEANVDAVLSREDVTAEERAHAAVVVHRATSRMTGLLEDLLATARSRSGAFADEVVDLPRLAAEAVDEYRILSADRGLVLSLALPPGPTVIGDREALARGLGNLLSNAVRLSPGGGEIVVASGSVRGWAWVAVRDEGPGIAEEDRDRVFQRFARTAGPDAAPTEGHGLGLTIARQVVEAHQGRIAVHSSPGAGATFVVWLPDRASTRPEQRAPAAPDDDPLGPTNFLA
ncbi:HAMP domain-containing histidine kinase [Phycicoccus sp. CMS6Z-2]|uniref:histidine kinase n=1 Tax=Phycicoccus flavus TaxID=2502783 RepID=A0A8T6QYF0_9MICO|nr:HAMP domain-containing histidine kinase [Phycicoccus flavus]